MEYYFREGKSVGDLVDDEVPHCDFEEFTWMDSEGTDYGLVKARDTRSVL